MANGVSTTNLDRAAMITELIANGENGTVLISYDDLATLLAGNGAVADQITPLIVRATDLETETSDQATRLTEVEDEVSTELPALDVRSAALEATSTDQETRLSVLENGSYADAIPYATSTAGIADTGVGQRFKVDNADADIAYDVYLHDTGGVAVFVESQPSVAALAVKADKALIDFNAILVGDEILICDLAGFIHTRLSTRHIKTKYYQVSAEKIVGGGVEILQSDGVAALSLRDGLGFTATIPTMGMLMRRSDKSGVYAADHLGFTCRLDGYDAPEDGVEVEPEVTAVPAASDGRSLYVLRSKLAGILSSTPSGIIAKVAYVGDSWGERTTSVNELCDILYGIYGQGSQGWLGAAQSNVLGGASASRSGDFTLHDITVEASSPYGPYGVSGDWLELGDTGSLTYAGLKGTSITIYYVDSDGTFSYSVDGGSSVTVAGGSSGDASKIEITGLDGSSDHILTISTAGNTGEVGIAGIYVTGIDGIEVSRMSNAGAYASSALLFMGSDMCANILADVSLDSAFISFGTNDVSGSKSPTVFKSGFQAIIDALQEARDNVGIIVASAPESSRTGAYEMSDYLQASVELCGENTGVEFLNLLDFFGPYAQTSRAGDSVIWNDSAHLNNVGGRMLSNLIIENFWK